VANFNQPFGLQFSGRTQSGNFCAQETMQADAAEAGAICINDLLQPEADGFIEANGITAGTTRYCGVNTGPFRAASAAVITDHLVIADRNATFFVQSTVGGLTQAAVKALANVTYAAGSATTRGVSQTVLNAATIDVTATLDLRIRALVPNVSPGFGGETGAFAWALVTINKHIDNPEVAGI
jgi:hypothetical protein